MQWLIKFIGWLGRLFNTVRRAVVQVLLFLIYLFGVGLVALVLGIRSLARGRQSSSTLQPAGAQDLSESGLKKMV